MNTVYRKLHRGIVGGGLLALAIGLAPLAAGGAEEASFEQRWHETIELVRDRFPDVKQMPTQKLARLLRSDTDILLIDTREPDEYAVSHLQGAHLATNIRDTLKVIESAPQDNPIVVLYCSVGYRSSKIAQRLERMGIKHVFNLEGSLFQWANEGRALHRGADRVRSVHPFDKDWGRLLLDEYHSTTD